MKQSHSLALTNTDENITFLINFLQTPELACTFTISFKDTFQIEVMLSIEMLFQMSTLEKEVLKE